MKTYSYVNEFLTNCCAVDIVVNKQFWATREADVQSMIIVYTVYKVWQPENTASGVASIIDLMTRHTHVNYHFPEVHTVKTFYLPPSSPYDMANFFILPALFLPENKCSPHMSVAQWPTFGRFPTYFNYCLSNSMVSLSISQGLSGEITYLSSISVIMSIPND